jgi:hypothetical protein
MRQRRQVVWNGVTYWLSKFEYEFNFGVLLK